MNVSLALTGRGEGADLSGTLQNIDLGDSESGKIRPLQDRGWVRAGAGQGPWGWPSMRQANSDFKIVTKRRKERKRWD